MRTERIFLTVPDYEWLGLGRMVELWVISEISKMESP